MQVNKYDLYLDVDYRKLSYKGSVTIYMSNEDVTNINAVDLTILRVKVDGRDGEHSYDGKAISIKNPVRERVEIEFEGKVPDLLMGIYRAPYEGGYMITTQFEATGARRMFPCIDHPAYKAIFKVTIKIDKDLDAIFNMPPARVMEEGGKKVIEFQETPKMSTYLLYLGIGKFEEVRDRLGNIDVIVATPPGKAKRGLFALDVAKKVIKYYEDYFNIPYILPKLHLIAVPEFAAGAMENWGAITFRETALLADENSSEGERRRVAEVVAHELAHQWFGDLVTMRWWDDLWLNESFATFMSYKAIDTLFPEWRHWYDFLLNETGGAMMRDSLSTTHPIHVPVNKEEEIEQIFDEISYGKGASVLRMMEAFLGEGDFRNGLRKYLKAHEYSNAAAEDLWKSLEEASGKPVVKIMEAWITKAGYPVISASLGSDGIKLKQARFKLAGDEEGKWPVPLTYYLNGDKQAQLMEGDLTIGGSISSFKLNIDQTGFYRARYWDWDAALKASKTAIDRWGIVSDIYANLLQGSVKLKDYLSFITKFHEEEDYLPAWEVSSQLSTLFAINVSIRPHSAEFHGAQLRLLEGRRDPNSALLRGIVANRLAQVDDEYAKRLASDVSRFESIDPNMRRAVATAYAVVGERPFETLASLYFKLKNDEDKVKVLLSMMSIRDPSEYGLALGLLLSGDVKRQDVGAAFSAGSYNPFTRRITLSWLKVNIDKLRRLYQATGTLSRIMEASIPFLGLGQEGELMAFLNGLNIPEADMGIKVGLELLSVYGRLRQ
ncbi:leucyl aminopeptidase [Thermocladium modestius]|uniref:Aminopeptidase n=1 Tax=Thermocladium modestius TaxID=62609 RepID=A0A830GV68_9CREN|nr:M1 family metallopeptidase [Thermocladium modestius]GGP20292.1 leucyl aminopeptidase [Thermocladium modestius]